MRGRSTEGLVIAPAWPQKDIAALDVIILCKAKLDLWIKKFTFLKFWDGFVGEDSILLF